MTRCVVCDVALPVQTGRGRPRVTCSRKCQDDRRHARLMMREGWAESNVEAWARRAADAEAEGATWAATYRRNAIEAAERLVRYRRIAR